ncbi:uncharacterized protein ND-B17 [Planococcus citri]|uniref:uncharacterized protein ND-B17 n=1 Tax=Planococcus citri TaxID=170843 RepID=UPI0031F9AE7E
MTDKDTFIQEKLVGYHDKPCSYWQRLPYRSDTGGVSPMLLEGLEKYTNHRIHGMTPDRRAWRKQFLLDQNLSHREPVFVPELYYEINNPIRRFLRYPYNKLEQAVLKITGNSLVAKSAKIYAVKSTYYLLFIFAASYYFMYNKRDWTRIGGITVQQSKPIIFPGAPGYPYESNMKLSEFYDMGFSKSALFKSEERIKAEYAKELEQKKLAQKKQ